MVTPYRLHYAPDNASLCVRLALEELDLPYETFLVDRARKAQRAPRYLALNPNGLIPVLETPDGPIFETAAILLWLGDRHPGLFAAPQAPERARTLKWLFWLSNTLHPALRMNFYPEVYLAESPDDMRHATQARLPALLDLLESHDPAQLGTGFLCYIAPMLRWLALYPHGKTDWFELSRWPGLKQLCQRADNRPAFICVANAEGLGPTPFSAPQIANPPEGSAL